MPNKTLHIPILFLYLLLITAVPLNSYSKDNKKSLSQIVLEQHDNFFSCEDLKKSKLDDNKARTTKYFYDLENTCSSYRSDTEKEACRNKGYFEQFAQAINSLVRSVNKHEEGGNIDKTIKEIYTFYAKTRDSVPKNINFGNEIDNTINILLSGTYPDSMKTAEDKATVMNFLPMKYWTFITDSMDLKKFLNEHKSFLSEIKNFNEIIPYYKDLCEKSVQNKESSAGIDNLSTCFLKVQSFTQAIKIEREIDHRKSKPKGKELVHGMNGQTNDKDCGIVNGIWSADSDANIIRSTLTIKLPNGEPRKFDVNVLKSYLEKIDKEIQTSPLSDTIENKNLPKELNKKPKATR
ncbi:MAG: hypothetical protein ACXVCP_08200 [Bdellovibrio sp.]